MNTFQLTDELETAEDGLRELRDLLYAVEFREDGMIDDDDLDLDDAAGAAVMALSSAFGAVKALAEAGVPIALPTTPLPLPDEVLVTILVNAELAQRKMHKDIEWVSEIMEKVRG